QVVGNELTTVDEIHRVVVVFFNTGRYGKDVRVENNVLRRETDFIDQHAVGTLTDFIFSRFGIGLTLLVERHHHHRRAIAQAAFGLGDKLFFAFFQGNGVHNGLALNALQAGFDDVPLGRVDHDRHPGNIRLGGNQIQEAHHGGLRIQHAFVHVDVDNLGAAFDLLARHTQRFIVVFFNNQPLEFGRAGDVGTLTDVNKQAVFIEVKRLQTGQPTGRTNSRNNPRLMILYRFGHGFDVRWSGATAAANNVQETGGGKFFHNHRHVSGRLIVLAEFIRKTGVRVRGNIGIDLIRQLFNVRTQLFSTQRAVQADRQRAGVGDGVPERLCGLAG